ncbi:tetratricopeptide repeat protein [Roseovarius aestuariivivens]|uniref:tetratricopeptide repeat protein n=1 Tax=Roseovarius aestuariivivens TaxID=1888910 RepID=UPI001080EF52|nr:tetratricopeptide repeat protein [Roseovarius aestuariivivens]
MRHLLLALVLICGLAGAVHATGCPPAPDHDAALSALIAEAREATSEAEGRVLSDEMWALWADAPDARAQDLLDTGMARRESFDYDAAMTAFDALVAYCPDYAEGYNQRAFVHFLRADYTEALTQLARALELSPRHVGALTGQALSYHALGRNAEAALALRAALALNPWLGERHLLPVLEAAEKEI